MADHDKGGISCWTCDRALTLDECRIAEKAVLDGDEAALLRLGMTKTDLSDEVTGEKE